MRYTSGVIEVSEKPAAPGAMHLELEGELDMATAPQIATRIARGISAGVTRAIIDLDRLSFIDSTGLGVLISSMRRLRRRGGSLTVVCSQEKILKAFRITGVDRLLTIQAAAH